MNRFMTAKRRLSCAASTLAAIQLAGCASAPAKLAPASAAVSAPAPAPAAIVTMAPIPNPQPSPSHDRRSSGRGRSAVLEAKHEHPKPSSSAPGGAASPALAADPARAARLRARGLEELDRGSVAQAVALLTQASKLDPTSEVIRHDLDRAERIARTVERPHRPA